MKYHGIHDLLKSFKCCLTLLIYDKGFRFRKEFHDKSKSQRSGLRVHLLRHNEDSLCFENEWTRPVKKEGSQVVLLNASSSLLRTFCSYKVKLSLRVIVEWVWPVPRRFTCRPLTVWHVAGARVCEGVTPTASSSSSCSCCCSLPPSVLSSRLQMVTSVTSWR